MLYSENHVKNWGHLIIRNKIRTKDTFIEIISLRSFIEITMDKNSSIIKQVKMICRSKSIYINNITFV